MNFQAVSVGQKLTGDGHVDSRGTAGAGLAIDRLRHGETVIADRIAAVTTLCCGNVAFTTLAGHMSPGTDESGHQRCSLR